MKMPTEFGQLLRTYRHSQEIRIEKICRALGCTKAYLMDVEFGRENPPDSVWINKWVDCVFSIIHTDYRQPIINQLLDAAQKSTVKPPTEWIDIKERQPEVGQMVLFVVDGLKKQINSGEYWGQIEDSHLVSMTGYRTSFSHWLPLDTLPPLPGSEVEG